MMSSALGDGPCIIPFSYTPYLPSCVINGCLSVGQMFKTPGLAKINVNVPNAAASGMFLEHFISLPDRMMDFEQREVFCFWNKSFQLVNLMIAILLLFKAYHYMPFLYAFMSYANIASVLGCQELVICLTYIKFFFCLEDNLAQ